MFLNCGCEGVFVGGIVKQYRVKNNWPGTIESLIYTAYSKREQVLGYANSEFDYNEELNEYNAGIDSSTKYLEVDITYTEKNGERGRCVVTITDPFSRRMPTTKHLIEECYTSLDCISVVVW